MLRGDKLSISTLISHFIKYDVQIAKLRLEIV